MCVIIHRPADKEISDRHLDACMARNPDGWGVMFDDRGRIETWRELDPKRFKDLYRQLDGIRLNIHFRKTTKGKTSDFNLHPFPVLNMKDHGMDLLMMHNGTFHDLPEVNGRSDTHYLAESILRPMLARDYTLIDNDGFQRLLAAFCGWSKLLFLDNEGGSLIFNKASGVEVDGVWFSNDYSHTHLDKPAKTGNGYSWSGYGANYQVGAKTDTASPSAVSAVAAATKQIAAVEDDEGEDDEDDGVHHQRFKPSRQDMEAFGLMLDPGDAADEEAQHAQEWVDFLTYSGTEKDAEDLVFDDPQLAAKVLWQATGGY